MPTYTQYSDGLAGASADTTSGPSNSIWADCPWLQILNEPGVGVADGDDFVRGSTAADCNWGTFLDAGSTVTYSDEINGAVVLTEATDNEAVYILGAPAFQITQNAGKLWFEARIKTSTITTAEQSIFCGLMDATAASEVIPLTATGALADVNLVGWHAPEANTTAIDFSYKADGVAAVEMLSNIGTLAAATYVKLGFVYDPDDPNTEAASLTAYYNGVRQANATNHPKTIPDDTGTDFPADVAMKMICGQLLGNSAAETITMDWWRCAQLRTA